MDRGKSNRTGQTSAAKRSRSLTGPEPASERGRGFRAVGVAVSKLGAPIVAKRGGGVLVRLKMDWPVIVGIEWAAVSWPTAMARDGSLRLRTSPAAALELQHRAPLLIERVNVFLGRSAVTRLILVQGPLPLPAAPSSGPPPSLASGQAAALDERLSNIANPELRTALVRLGRVVIATRR